MYIVEEEADDPEGKKRRQVILKRAGLQGSAEPSETGATGSELSERGVPWLGVHVQSGGGGCGNSASAEVAFAGPWALPLRGGAQDRGKGPQDFPP